MFIFSLQLFKVVIDKWASEIIKNVAGEKLSSRIH